MKQPVIKFESIECGNEEELRVLCNLFETQGWAFVRMPQEATAATRPAFTHLDALLRNPPFVGPYTLCSGRRHGPSLGLYHSPQKVSFTCPTGTELNSSIAKGLPNSNQELRPACRALAAYLDDCLMKIVEATSALYFCLSPQELGAQFDLPFLDRSSTEGEENKRSAFALFDAAFYEGETATFFEHEDKNEQYIRRIQGHQKRAKTDDCRAAADGTGARCAEHYDPGLYSLWAGETKPGLKFKDDTGEWVPPHPDGNVFVLWLGKAAQDANPKFVAAMHRVDAPSATCPPRLSVWSELCTRDQIAPKKWAKFVSADIIEVRNARGKDKLRVRVQGGNLNKALATVSSILRMPMSKVILAPVFDEDGFVDRIESQRALLKLRTNKLEGQEM